MRIGDENDYIELVELDRGTADSERDGQRRMSVHIRLRDFQGWYDKIWVQDGALDKFISGLAGFTDDCSGHIKLHSANPNEFILRLYSMHDAEHLGVEVHLSCIHYAKSDMFNVNLTGGFQINSTSLPSILGDFKKMVV